MRDPLVTLIIPCYNVEKYVRRAIQSIIAQTYDTLEILIADDASVDNTLVIIKSIKDARIQIIELKKNSKKIDSVNQCIQMAKGEYIAFQDADDWSVPGRIMKQLQEIRASQDTGICFTNYEIFDHRNRKQKDTRIIAQAPEDIVREFVDFGYYKNKSMKPMMCATMMVTSDLIKSIGGFHPYFKGRVAEDIHLVYNLLKATRPCVVPEKLYSITRSRDSLTDNQLSGKNAKSAYSWEILKIVIDYDKRGIDLLDKKNVDLLLKEELLACELQLVKTIQEKNQITKNYDKSFSLRIGKFISAPFRFSYALLKSLFTDP